MGRFWSSCEDEDKDRVDSRRKAFGEFWHDVTRHDVALEAILPLLLVQD